MASITQFIIVRVSSHSNIRSLPQVPQSDNIVLAPVTIHPDPSDTAILQPDEFPIKGQQYIRCSSLAKHRRAQRSGFRWSGSMARTSNPSVTRKISAAKKLATFVSDQREMDQGVHVPNSTEGAHHLRRWAFLWRYVVHNKKYVLLGSALALQSARAGLLHWTGSK